MSRTLLAVLALTGAMLRRLLREGLVLRSLAFPVGLTAGTLVVTLAVVGWVRPQRTVAVPHDLDPALSLSLEEAGFMPVSSDAPPEDVGSRAAWAGTDGHTVWWSFPTPDNLVLEAVVREHVGADWTPSSVAQLPQADSSAGAGLMVVRLIGALFVLYGIVFGVGMVARDRDDATLEAELALPVPRWVHGASRWLSGSLLLVSFFTVCVLVFAALFSLEDMGAVMRHGAAAGSGAIAVGLMVVGRSGLKSGFSSVLSMGLLAGTVLMGLGMVVPSVAAWLPVASLLTGGAGWAPLGGALLLGGASSLVFGWRSTT